MLLRAVYIIGGVVGFHLLHEQMTATAWIVLFGMPALGIAFTCEEEKQ